MTAVVWKIHSARNKLSRPIYSDLDSDHKSIAPEICPRNSEKVGGVLETEHVDIAITRSTHHFQYILGLSVTLDRHDTFQQRKYSGRERSRTSSCFHSSRAVVQSQGSFYVCDGCIWSRRQRGDQNYGAMSGSDNKRVSSSQSHISRSEVTDPDFKLEKTLHHRQNAAQAIISIRHKPQQHQPTCANSSALWASNKVFSFFFVHASTSSQLFRRSSILSSISSLCSGLASARDLPSSSKRSSLSLFASSSAANACVT